MKFMCNKSLNDRRNTQECFIESSMVKQNSFARKLLLQLLAITCNDGYNANLSRVTTITSLYMTKLSNNFAFSDYGQFFILCQLTGSST